MIVIIDCGSQLTQNIARRVRELGVYAEIIPFSQVKDSAVILKSHRMEGVIISGGQFSVYDEGSPLYSKEVFELGIPVLGICYGQQSMAYLLGGKVVATQKREYGQTRVKLLKPSPLFREISASEITVWMSHGDVVEQVPEGFEITAKSQVGHVAAMQKGNLFAVQFHPEVDHTEQGRKILDNFLVLCQAARVWDPTKMWDQITDKVQAQIKGRVGVGGISGGVDSTAASVLVGKWAGQSFHPIFVDNGLLRENEVEEVKTSLQPFGLNLHCVDARERFLTKLKGVVDPDEKRKRIGHEFIAVFEEVARSIKGASYLVQGTLYPDVVESVPIFGSSSKIRRHHNVGGLPERLGLEIIEPFRNLFKDEVRKLAEEKLGLPKEVVWRHPFPGPGLAVRIIGEVTQQKLEMLQKADAMFITELKKRGLYDKIGQAFAVLLNTKAIGVMGDEGTYQHAVALRAITTNDFMTSDVFHFDWNDLKEISNRIINEVRGINRVTYDTTQKPPGTIEWE